ncbi:MAG: GNAT family N-acetyltransferase [Micromonosporaceae bacterium]|nr:GNAT family N-acetyltransferase [Micromonosporaceae bacterium]
MVGLAALLDRIERGGRLPTDPWRSLVPAPAPDTAAVVAFPDHVVVAADVDEPWVRERLPDGDLSAPLNPPFLGALAERLGRRVNCIDGLYLAPAVEGPPDLPLRDAPDLDHPRVRRARRYRPRVRVWVVDGGVLVLGQGLAGRWEVAVEVDPTHRGRGLGRSLASAARHLVPEHRPVWAQVSPGNAASVRAFLAAGYRPVGAEALLVP